MANLPVTGEVLAAILAGQTQITRRAEIYEADAVTPFIKTNGRQAIDLHAPKVKTGSVSVSYDRDDRRNIDVTFANSEKHLSHDPNGFWYDKIIKVFRGVQWVNTKTNPSICILNTPQSAYDPGVVFRRIGFNNITYLTTTDPGQVMGYDLVVAQSAFSDFDATTASILQAVYAAGQNVITFSPSATSASVPFILTTVAVSNNNAYNLKAATSAAAPFLPNARTQVNSVPGDRAIATMRSSAIPIVSVYDSTTYVNFVGYGAAVETSTTGGRWFHYNVRMVSGSALTVTKSDYSSYATLNSLMKAGVQWVYGYQQLRTWETQLGEFMIDKITETRFPPQIQVTGRDYSKKCMNSKFDAPVTFSAGQSIDSVVRALGANAGITKFRLNSANATIGSPVTFDRAASRWDAMKQICENNNIEIFFDRFGYLVTRPFLDPTLAPVSLSLSTKQGVANLVDWTKTSDDGQLYNRVIVTGENTDDAATGNIWQGVAVNDNPASPTCWQRIGYRDYYYTSSFFTSNAQCQAYATKLLSTVALEQFSLDYSSLVFPWVEVGEVNQFYDPSPNVVGAPTRFLMTDLTYPLDLGPMTGSGKRLIIVGKAN